MPPKPVGQPRIVDKLKKGKGVAVSSKQKQGKRNTPSDTSAKLVQPRSSGAPRPKKHQQLGTPSGLKNYHPLDLKNIQLSVSLTKLTEPQLPGSPTESKDPYLSFLTDLEKSGPLEKPAKLKKRPGRPKSLPKDIEQKGKKRKAVDISPARTVKRVKLKHDNLDVSSSKKKNQKHSSSFKSGQLIEKKITRPGSRATKTKSKVSENEPVPDLEFGSTLLQTLAHLPLLKAKSSKPKPKTVAQNTLPVSKPVIKAAQIKKKEVRFTHSKAAVKRAQQILSQKEKGKTALVPKNKIKKRDQTDENNRLPHLKTSVKRGKQILSQKSKTNKTTSASRKKVAKKSLTVVENESHDNEVNEFNPIGCHTFYKINIPAGLEPFDNKQFWQPSVILKKLEDIVILGITKSTKELDTVNTEDIKVATDSQIPVNIAEEKTPKENFEPIVQHPNSKENLLSSLTVGHSSKKKLHVITDSYRRKSKKSVDEKEVVEQVPQSISQEEGEANKSVTVEETPNHPKPGPPKGTKVQRRHSLTSGNSAVEEPLMQYSAVNKKVKGRSKRLGSTSEELEKQKQGVMEKPQSKTFLLKETDDWNSNESMQKTVCIAVPEDTKMANNKDSPLISQQSKTENKEISHFGKTDTSVLSKRRARRNSDQVSVPPVSQDDRNEIVKASQVDSQSDDVPKKKRRHSDLMQSVPGKRTRLQLKDMPEHNKSLNCEETTVDEVSILKKKEVNVKTVALLRKTKVTIKDKAKQAQDIWTEVKMSRIQAENEKSEETAKASKSVANTAREQVNESNSSHKKVVRSNISLDSVESPETDIDSDVSTYLVTKESNLVQERREDPNISDKLRLLDPSFIEEANLSELLTSDSSCDNMSWNSLNVIANQRKAEKLRKDFFILQKNLAILKEAKAKRDELYKDIAKQMKDYVMKQVSSIRSEKI